MNDARRCPYGNAEVGNVAGDDAASADHAVTADRHPRENDDAVADPGVSANANGAFLDQLGVDGSFEIIKSVVAVGDEDLMARPHIVTNLDRPVGHYRAVAADDAAIADRQHTIWETHMVRSPTRRQNHLAPDQGVLADVDRRWVDSGDRRVTQHRAVPERSKLGSDPRMWTDDADLFKVPLGTMDEVAGDAVIAGPHKGADPLAAGDR